VSLRASATVAFLPLIFLTSRAPQAFTDPLQGGPPCDAVQDDAGHFEQIATRQRIAALRDAPIVADLTRPGSAVASGRRRPHTAGFGKPRRIVDDADEGQRDHGSDARHRHQPPHRLVTAPDASAPCAWNTSFARSNPIVLTSPTDASFKWSSTPHFGTSMPSGGVHAIKARERQLAPKTAANRQAARTAARVLTPPALALARHACEVLSSSSRVRRYTSRASRP
jgi:hypothetical protein